MLLYPTTTEPSLLTAFPIEYCPPASVPRFCIPEPLVQRNARSPSGEVLDPLTTDPFELIASERELVPPGSTPRLCIPAVRVQRNARSRTTCPAEVLLNPAAPAPLEVTAYAPDSVPPGSTPSGVKLGGVATAPAESVSTRRQPVADMELAKAIRKWAGALIKVSPPGAWFAPPHVLLLFPVGTTSVPRGQKVPRKRHGCNELHDRPANSDAPPRLEPAKPPFFWDNSITRREISSSRRFPRT